MCMLCTSFQAEGVTGARALAVTSAMPENSLRKPSGRTTSILQRLATNGALRMCSNSYAHSYAQPPGERIQVLGHGIACTQLAHDRVSSLAALLLADPRPEPVIVHSVHTAPSVLLSFEVEFLGPKKIRRVLAPEPTLGRAAVRRRPCSR